MKHDTRSGNKSRSLLDLHTMLGDILRRTCTTQNLIRYPPNLHQYTNPDLSNFHHLDHNKLSLALIFFDVINLITLSRRPIVTPDPSFTTGSSLLIKRHPPRYPVITLAALPTRTIKTRQNNNYHVQRCAAQCKLYTNSICDEFRDSHYHHYHIRNQYHPN